jgi:hypothetical protein
MAALLVAASSSWANNLSMTFGLDVDTNYTFRGAKRGPFGLLPELNADYSLGKGFSFIGNLVQYVKVDGGFNFGEGLYRAALQFKPPIIGKLATMQAGFNWYTPSSNLTDISFAPDNTNGKNTGEWFGQLAFNVPGTPTLAVMHDFVLRSGTYWRLSASRQQTVMGDWHLDLAGSLGLDFGHGLGGWRDGLVHVGVTRDIAPGLAIGPMADFELPNSKVDPGSGFVKPVFGFTVQYTPTRVGGKASPASRLGPGF